MSTQDFSLPMQNGAEQLSYTDDFNLPDGDYSSIQLDQDVNATLDFPAYEEPEDAESWMKELGFDDTYIQPAKRTDSGLNARAKSFYPSGGLWTQPQRQTFTSASGAQPNSAPRSFPQQLTRIQTNFDSWPQTAYSAPAHYNDPYNGTSVSPMVTITDETQRHPQGVQWHSAFPPTENIGAWATTSSFHAGGQLDVCYDNNMLTPTSPNASVRSASRSRSSSIASAATYTCEFPGCNKTFTVKTEFSHHKRNHGPRNHNCPHCSKKFIFKKDMARHEKIHSPNSREYFCEYEDCQWASRGFQRKDHCTRHMKTHEERSSGILTPVTSSTNMSRSPSHR